MLAQPLPIRARRIAIVVALVAALSGGVLIHAGNATAATATVQDVAGTTSLAGIACDDVDSCIAVGDDTGNAPLVVPIANGHAGTPVPIPGVSGLLMRAVACGSPGHCVATGETGQLQTYVVPIDAGVPGNPVAVDGLVALYGIACPTASLCITGGLGNSETIVAITTTVSGGTTTLVPGPAQVPPGSPDPGIGEVSMSSVACVSSSTCYGVSQGSPTNDGAVIPIVDGVAGSAVSDAGSDGAIACPSTVLCYALGSYLRLVNDGVPIDTTQAVPIEARAVACASATACVAVGDGGNGFPITGGDVGSVQSVDGVSAFRGLACPSATICYAVGDGASTGVLSTLTAPTTTSPANQTAAAGTDATFTVSPAGSPAPDVQWQVSDDGGTTFTNVPGANAATYTLPGVTAGDSGQQFRAVVNNVSGSATSDAATLTVGTAPAITSGAAASFTIGTSGTFALTATGDPAPTISEAGALPDGVTFTAGPAGTAELTGTPAAGTAGTYPLTITATNGVAPDASQTFALTIAKAAATNTLTSSGDSVTEGAAVTLTATVVAASGPGKPSGSVDFFDGTAKIGTATLTGDPVATFSTSTLAVGTHRLTAAYGGDGTFAAATSGAPVIVVVAASSEPSGPSSSPASSPSATPDAPISSAVPTSSEVSLSDTGSPTASLVGSALALLLIGGLAVLMGSRRRRAAHRH